MARNPHCTCTPAGQPAWHSPGQALRMLYLLLATVFLSITCASAQEVATTSTSDPAQIAQMGLDPASLPRRHAVITKIPDTQAAVLPGTADGVVTTSDASDASDASAAPDAPDASDASAPIVKVDTPRPRSAATAARMVAQLQAQYMTTTEAGAVTTMAMSPTYQTILNKHNTYRSWHQAGALTWSDNLASAAASYAARCTFAHDPNANAGENLWAISTVGDVAGALSKAIDDWYNEISQYNFASPGFSGATGHFTQVVWRGTSLLGCAAASCNNGLGGGAGWPQGTFVVCRYSPAGNVLGQFQSNVLPRTSGGSTPPPAPAPAPTPPPSGTIPPATLPAGYRYSSPGCLYSVNSRFRLCMQTNGQVVLIDGSNSSIKWATSKPATANSPYRLTMQTDGNLVAFDASGRAAWMTGAPGRGTRPYKMVVQDNGNVVVSDSLNQRMWATNPASP